MLNPHKIKKLGAGLILKDNIREKINFPKTELANLIPLVSNGLPSDKGINN